MRVTLWPLFNMLYGSLTARSRAARCLCRAASASPTFFARVPPPCFRTKASNRMPCPTRTPVRGCSVSHGCGGLVQLSPVRRSPVRKRPPLPPPPRIRPIPRLVHPPREPLSSATPPPPPPQRSDAARSSPSPTPLPPPVVGHCFESASSCPGGASMAGSPPLSSPPVWRSPQDVLALMVDYIPTFFVPVPGVAAILPEELRARFAGRLRLVMFLRRYSFLFELHQVETTQRMEVRLRPDVTHPRKGAANDKFVMTDVGEVRSYVAKTAYITSLEMLDAVGTRVNITRPTAPPALCIDWEVRVPVMERLAALLPATHFRPIADVEAELPDDILFHPYFDSQGGPAAIASKFPEQMQVVGQTIRARQPHLAPLALDDYTLSQSPLPDVAALVRREVCDGAIPHWVPLTGLYEQLSREQRRAVKSGFRSFAGFLRAHGRSLSVSTDMLKVAMWVSAGPAPHRNEPDNPTGGERLMGSGQSVDARASRSNWIAGSLEESTPPTPTPTTTMAPSQVDPMRVINLLFDLCPPDRTLTLPEAVSLLPAALQPYCGPMQLMKWVTAFPNYFVLLDRTMAQDENDDTNDSTKSDGHARRWCIQRASPRAPLDLALIVYKTLSHSNTNTTGRGDDTRASAQSNAPYTVDGVEECPWKNSEMPTMRESVCTHNAQDGDDSNNNNNNNNNSNNNSNSHTSSSHSYSAAPVAAVAAEEGEWMNVNVLMHALTPEQRGLIQNMGGLTRVVELLPDWLELSRTSTHESTAATDNWTRSGVKASLAPMRIRARQSWHALRRAIASEKSKMNMRRGRQSSEGGATDTSA